MKQVWDLNTGHCIDTLQAHTNVVMGLLCWNQFLISGSLDGTVKVRYYLLFSCKTGLVKFNITISGEFLFAGMGSESGWNL